LQHSIDKRAREENEPAKAEGDNEAKTEK